MARKNRDKADIDCIRKKISKEFERTSSQIETLIGEALKQIDSLQHQIQEPVKKLIADLEQIRGREMKRFHDKFERRMSELQETQSSLLGRLGAGSKAVKKSLLDKASRTVDAAPEAVRDKAAAAADSANRGKAVARSARSTSKPAKAIKAARTPKPAPAREQPGKAQPAKPETLAQPVPGSAGPGAQPRSGKRGSQKDRDTDLMRIKGIGRVTAQRLQEKGITRIQQIADPGAEDRKVLEQFKTGRGLEVWIENARQLTR